MRLVDPRGKNPKATSTYTFLHLGSYYYYYFIFKATSVINQG